MTVGGIAAGLVAAGQVDVGLRQHHQRIVVGAAVDDGFGAAIDHSIVAGAGMDDIGAAAAIDRVGPGTAGDDVDAGRAGD